MTSFLVPINDTQLESIKKEEFYRPAASVDEDVTQLIEWLSKQPHLPSISDRKWLTHFIKGCKYNLQRSKKVIESYLIVRAEFPEFFGSFTRDSLEKVAKNGKMSIFPNPTSDGCRIFCTKTNPTTDDDCFEPEQFCKASLAVLDLMLKAEPVYGNIVIYDLKNIRLSQFLAFTPTITKNFVKCCTDAFPMRVKTVHYVNPPKFISRLVMFFKMFLTNKIKERIMVHDTLEGLHQFVPKDILPDIYGGTNGTIASYEDYLFELLLDNKEWLEARPKADLSKRPGASRSDELDMNGTFKKLQID